MSRIIHALYIGTVFLGAMLGFQIQPLMSSVMQPWFGGSPAVWTMCLMFFQVSLFAGYYYAFRLIRLFAVRGQFVIHAGLLCAALFFPVLPGWSWKPQGGGESRVENSVVVDVPYRSSVPGSLRHGTVAAGLVSPRVPR